MPMLRDDYKKEEKIDGTIYNMTPSPHFFHGIANGNIYAILKQGLKDSICLVFMENLDYKYHADESDDYVIPDIMIVCDRKYLKGSSYIGVPKFIVETISPGTFTRDITTKKDIYEKAGVEEYWIVSPKERAVQIYYLENEKYVLHYSEVLEDDREDERYNGDTVIALREFPHITMTLEEIFQGIEE